MAGPWTTLDLPLYSCFHDRVVTHHDQTVKMHVVHANYAKFLQESQLQHDLSCLGRDQAIFVWFWAVFGVVHTGSLGIYPQFIQSILSQLRMYLSIKQCRQDALSRIGSKEHDGLHVEDLLPKISLFFARESMRRRLTLGWGHKGFVTAINNTRGLSHSPFSHCISSARSTMSLFAQSFISLISHMPNWTFLS